ncbi:hypothetical protein [Pseudomonas quasicaspiana]|uniref:hypothetical protein n=1 Tax=Pseudomonas quasicaspiana TaxID=2829821 RepID=UPI001E2FBCDF|nr:hypothetical protein [Pseudomonas quasicaspiana]MCD5977698.1 hypothetical protein [Pseudomonas quasicaspiana]
MLQPLNACHGFYRNACSGRFICFSCRDRRMCGQCKIYWNMASLLIEIQAWPRSAWANQGQDEQRVFKGEAELNRWVQIFSSGFAEVNARPGCRSNKINYLHVMGSSIGTFLIATAT